MTEPNRANIRAWVDALRSGEYEQGIDRLATRDNGGTKHCCLGVVSVLACNAGVAVDSSWVNLTYYEKLVFEWDDAENGRAFADTFLPDPVRRWLGLSSHIPQVANDYLANLNDDGKSFATIADLIEAEWLTDTSKAGA
ncbi:MAG: hypothetical protein ACRDK0_01400 [Solirubrobacteraceae bacterium]